MKKIGILTFHFSNNYGAVLQTFALKQTLKNMGYKVEVINYIPLFYVKLYSVILPKGVKMGALSFCKRLAYSLLAKLNPKWTKSVAAFRKKHLDLTDKVYRDKSELDNNSYYDYYIFGSDQIWNPSITKYDTTYFGDFKPANGAKKIAYAASMSNYNLDPNRQNEIKSLLGDFALLGVRENELQNYLQSNFGLNSTVVLDPTLILDVEQWSKIAKETKFEKYVLVYALGLRSELMALAKEIARERGLRVVELTSGKGIYKSMFDKTMQAASPEEFVGLFQNADYVITSSFHGTAFSLIFNRQFYVLGSGTDKDSRKKSLLTPLELNDRLIYVGDKVNFDVSIDYTKVNEKLAVKRRESMKFIEDSLRLGCHDNSVLLCC